MQQNGIDSDAILAQMGLTQWRLREPNRLASSKPQEVAAEAVALDEQTVDKPIAMRLQQFSGLPGSALQAANWLIVQQSESEQQAQAADALYSDITKALKLQQTGVQTPLNQSEFSSAAAAAASIAAAIAASNVDLVIVFGPELSQTLLAHKQETPLLEVRPQQVGTAIIPLLVLPTLQHLLDSPTEKRAVWEALKQAMTLSK